MKVNINKEMLLKHRFWVMLAIVPLLGLGMLIVLVTVVRGAIDLKRQEFDKATDSSKAESAKTDVKTPPMIALVKKLDSELAGTADGVHLKGYLTQESFIAFPKELEDGDVEKGEFEFKYVPSKNGMDKGLFAEMIRINKDKDAPADNDLENNIVHGVITEHTTTFIVVKDRKGKLWRFFESPILEPGKRMFRAGDAKNPLTSFANSKELDPPNSVSVFFQKGKFFGDPLTSAERNKYRDVFKEQIYPILALVDPIDEAGRGRVQLGTRPYEADTDPPDDSLFIDVPRNRKADALPLNEDFSEDFWIFQENLAIYRELYTLIKNANDSVAKFDLKKNYAKPKEEGKPPKEYVCTNPYWEITLKMAEKDGEIEATFKNLLSRSQRFDFDLKFVVSKDPSVEPVVIRPPKDVVIFNPKGSSLQKKTAEEGEDVRVVSLGKVPIDLNTTEILEVWQELNWETAAVRRIDGIYISAVNSNGISESHRSFPKQLKAYVRPVVEPAVTAAPDKAPAAKDKKGGVPDKAKTPAAGNVAGKKSIYGNDETETRLGQTRERYTEVNRQLRRLPVAVVLIAEQTQVDRVQTAFNNSRMRFLTEQVILTQFTGSLRPTLTAAARDPGKVAPVAPKSQPKIDSPKKGKAPRDTRPPPSPGSLGGGGDELEANVEIVIYGTITIYERFPYRRLPPKWD